jgi:hypothetical protein
VAIYTTVVVCDPQELVAGFPGWRTPLPNPVKREVKNPFTGEMMTIETREPDWGDDDGTDPVNLEYQVVSIEGNYQDYLDGRLPGFIRSNQHWATKNLTVVELAPLAEAVGEEPRFECPLYSPPSLGAILHEFPVDMVAKFASLDDQGLDAVAKKWAATMSTPEYTHSVTGLKLDDGWSATEAMEVLKPLVDLARKTGDGQRMYLFIE